MKGDLCVGCRCKNVNHGKQSKHVSELEKNLPVGTALRLVFPLPPNLVGGMGCRGHPYWKKLDSSRPTPLEKLANRPVEVLASATLIEQKKMGACVVNKKLDHIIGLAQG